MPSPSKRYSTFSTTMAASILNQKLYSKPCRQTWTSWVKSVEPKLDLFTTQAIAQSTKNNTRKYSISGRICWKKLRIEIEMLKGWRITNTTRRMRNQVSMATQSDAEILLLHMKCLRMKSWDSLIQIRIKNSSCSHLKIIKTLRMINKMIAL